VLAGHCIWCSGRDISLLAAHGVAVAHNPVANMILASGVCPVAALKREGIAVALGTDGAASNDNQDMLGVMKTAALLHKVHALRADAITAKEVVRMATIEGARALGLEALVGSLEPGKRADLVLLDGNTPELAAIHDPWQQVVYSATPRCVSSVWVDGRERVRDGYLVGVDLRELAGEARALASELAVRAGLTGESAYAGQAETTAKPDLV
jgi:cytosine/adenosine deaminase-related metal-dependent hydrolase